MPATVAGGEPEGKPALPPTAGALRRGIAAWEHVLGGAMADAVEERPAERDGPEPLRRTTSPRSGRVSRRHAPARRAISVGSVLGRAFTIWMSNVAPFTLLSVVCFSPVIVYEIATTESGVGPLDSGLLDVLVRLAGNGISLIASGAMAYGVVSSLRGQPAGFSSCLSTGLRRFPSLLGTALLVLVYLIVVGFVLGLLGGVVFGVVGGVVGGVLYALALWIPLGIVMALFWVAVPAAAVERVTPGRAIQRSKDLTRGNMTASFLIVAIPLIANAGFGILIMQVAARGTEAVDQGLYLLHQPIYDRPLMVFAPLALQVLVLGPLTAVAAGIGYHDLRRAQEGVSADELAKVFE
jgi:hypothetical protein